MANTSTFPVTYMTDLTAGGRPWMQELHVKAWVNSIYGIEELAIETYGVYDNTLEWTKIEPDSRLFAFIKDTLVHDDKFYVACYDEDNGEGAWDRKCDRDHDRDVRDGVA